MEEEEEEEEEKKVDVYQFDALEAARSFENLVGNKRLAVASAEASRGRPEVIVKRVLLSSQPNSTEFPKLNFTF